MAGTSVPEPGKQSGWLSRMVAKSQSAPAVFDGCAGDPHIRAAVEGMIHGNWSIADELMDRRPRDVWLISDSLAGIHADVALGAFEKWASESPSARSLSLLGRAQTREAWETRTALEPDGVDAQAWETFYEAVQAAENTLESAIELDAKSADPWTGLLISGRHLKVENAELRRRFRTMYPLAPFRPDACSQYLQCVAKKWGGTHDAMFEFARWVEAEAPADSAAHSVIFEAHYEYSINEESLVRPADHFYDGDVATELEAAAANYLEATPAEPEPRHLLPLNWMVNTMIPRDQSSAVMMQEAIDRIGGRVTSSPWAAAPGSDAAGDFQDARDARLGVVRRFVSPRA